MEATGRVLLVTGGSRGIGAAVARMAAARGYAVAFSYVENEAAASALRGELAAGGARVFCARGDVADPAFAEWMLDEVAAGLGPVTDLVNNAGITGRYGPFTDLPLDALRKTLDVNILGTMLLSQAVARRWLAAGEMGRIVNLSSIAATLGAPGEYVHYAAAKGAVDAFTVGLGKELGPHGIRVNAVAAGTTHTDIHAAVGVPDRPQKVVGRVPLGRIAEPDDIAEAVMWLLSDAASYVTATVVRVSGGV